MTKDVCAMWCPKRKQPNKVVRPLTERKTVAHRNNGTSGLRRRNWEQEIERDFKRAGRSFNDALDHMIRKGVRRQYALGVVRKVYELPEPTRPPWRPVPGGTVSPK